MTRRIIVTGGAGFIGSAVVRQYIAETTAVVINVDKLTYAGNLESLGEVRHDSRHSFEEVDICNRAELDRVLREYRPAGIMHLAAESHVDRSIRGAADFVTTNVVGTYTLLEAARAYWNGLERSEKAAFRFHHVSTDEVYGDLGPSDPAFTEKSPYAPSSPYAASKASSDHLVRAWYRTYGFPVVLSNCSNNYGPCQYPEKLIPLTIMNALEGKALPVYGEGDNVRDWLYVEDHAAALREIFLRGLVGQTYNIGGGAERTNLEVVEALCARLDQLLPDTAGPYARLIKFVCDRPGHDRRYAIDSSRITQELNWRPRESFVSGLEKTVQWYLENRSWLRMAKSRGGSSNDRTTNDGRQRRRENMANGA